MKAKIQSIFRRILSVRRRFTRLMMGQYYTFLLRICGATCGTGLRAESGILFKYPPHPGLEIGNNVELGRHIVFDVPPGGVLKLGDRSKLTGYTTLAATRSLTIGQDTLIGENVSIRDANHGANAMTLVSKQAMLSQEIIIGNDVWIGRGVAVLPGAIVESGVIIGANSVLLSGETIPFGIYVGVPARLVKKRQ